MNAHNAPKYAGFWRRFSAYLIDASLFNLSAFIIVTVTFGFLRAPAIGRFSLILLYLVLPWLYFTIMESSPRQATFGKIAVGANVTTLGVERISFGRANARYWCKLISTLILNIGFIAAGVTKKKQALHDIMAKCLVVYKGTDEPHFTTKFNIAGIALMLGLSILLVAYFHYQLYSKPILPSLNSLLVNFHASLGLIAYAGALTSLIVSVLGVLKNRMLPKIVIILQAIGIVTFSLSVILGAVWANSAWGSYWSWDPKQTWALILLFYIMVPVFFILSHAIFNWLKVLALSIQLATIVLVATSGWLLGGLHSWDMLF